MQRRKKIVVGNWKMNPNALVDAKSIFSKIKRVALRAKKTQTVICPPFVHVAPLVSLAGKSSIAVGVQDVFWEDQGSFTGSISASQAKGVGAQYAIVGHSERRKQGEDNEQVARKLFSATKQGLVGILCVGESARDREGNFFAQLKDQILASLSNIAGGVLARSVIIAYEPVWEVGRSDFQAMKPSDIHETSIFIRRVITDVFGPEVAQQVPVLYGGSVSVENAVATVFEGEVDGLLIGRQSLIPENFCQIIKQIDAGK